MNRLVALSVVATLAVLFCLTLLAPAQEKGEEQPLTEVDQLRREVWALKHLMLHEDLLEKAGMGPDGHEPRLPVTVAPLDKDTTALLELKPGRGLEVKDVKAGIPGLEPGDVILRLKNGFTGWQPATKTTLAYLFLPGDTATFQVHRKGQRLVAQLVVGCQCGKGQGCPYLSSLAGPPDPGVKRHVVKPIFPDPDRPWISADILRDVWKRAIDGYFDDLEKHAGDASHVEDMQKRLNRHAREAGCRDWTDLATKAAMQDAEKYKRVTEYMTRYTTERARAYAAKMMAKAREREKEDGKKGEDGKEEGK